MKLRNHQFSTRPRIFEGSQYEHPWYDHVDDNLNRPNPPSIEAVKRAKFVDKTYHWDRPSNIRPRSKRTTK